MPKTVVKRDGKEVSFDQTKIMNAISKACGDVSDETMSSTDLVFLTEKVVAQIDATGKNKVEEIQDIVEDTLSKYDYPHTAKAYILFRSEQAKCREAKSRLMKTYDKITFGASKDVNLKRENGNINGDTAQGTMMQYGSEGAKYFLKNFVLPKDIADAFESGDIYIHDADYYMLTETCCQINLKKLFDGGFNTEHGHIREPQSISTYAALCCIAMQANQNDMHGGQSIPAFDYYMADGVRKTYNKELHDAFTQGLMLISDYTEDDVAAKVAAVLGEGRVAMSDVDSIKLPSDHAVIKAFYYAKKRAYERTDRLTYQAMEALVYNLCSMHSRGGGQIIFSSINYGLDTSPEGRMVINNILKVTDAGLDGAVAIFPVQIFQLKAGVNYNEGDPNYDLFKQAMLVSAKRMYPNYMNLDAPYNLQYYKEGDSDTHVATMGCVRGNETVAYSFSATGSNMKLATIAAAFTNLAVRFGTKQSGESQYVDLLNEEVYVADSHTGHRVKVLKAICNPNKNNWYLLTFSGGKTLTLTEDHPLPVDGKGRTFVRDMVIGDKVTAESGELLDVVSIETIELDEPSYDFETESDRFDVSGVRSHNCRTRVMGNVYDPTREVTSGRGNLSFTTVNLPRIGIESRGDWTLFYEKLDKVMDMVFRQLLHRLEIQSKRKVRNYPFLMANGIWLDSENLSLDDEIGEVLKHGTLTCGLIGLAETLVAMMGKHHGESEEAQQRGLEIIAHMRKRCDEESQKRKLNFSLIGTPAEGLSGKFVKLDREKYGIIPGVTDKSYYTNSTHVPVYFKIKAYDKIRIEAPYHAYENGGHICYVEFDGNAAKNPEAFEAVIRCMHDNNVGYGAINIPTDFDSVCGYCGIIENECPRCGRKDGEGITVEKYNELRRKYGYMSTLSTRAE